MIYLKQRTFLFILVLTIASLLGSLSAFAQAPEPPLPPELEDLLAQLGIDMGDLPINSELGELLTSVDMDQLPIDIDVILAELGIPADAVPDNLPPLDIADLPIDWSQLGVSGGSYEDILASIGAPDGEWPMLPPDVVFDEWPEFPIDFPIDFPEGGVYTDVVVITDVVEGEWPSFPVDFPIEWPEFPIDFPEGGVYTDVVVITDVSGFDPGAWPIVTGTVNVGDFPIDIEALLDELGIDPTVISPTMPSEIPFDLGTLPIDIEALLGEMGAPEYIIPEQLPAFDFTDIPSNLEAILAELQLPHFNGEFDQPIGAPGSSFVFTGTNFAPNDIATILIDGLPMGTVHTDPFGNVDFALEILDMIGDGNFDVSLIIDGIETDPVDVVVDDGAGITPLASDYDGTVVPLGSSSVPLAVGMSGQTAVTTTITTLLLVTLLLGSTTIATRRN